MAAEQLDARFQLKDEKGNVVTDEEGKPSWTQASINYDFGDDLTQASERFGVEVVFSLYKAQAKIAGQALIRSKLKAGLPVGQLQGVFDVWKPGMVMERTSINPEDAIKSAFASWSPEKQSEFLAQLGVPA